MNKSYKKKKKKPHLINEQIKADTVRLIGEHKGIVVSLEEALKMAKEEELDLVQVSSNKEIICTIVDYNKYLYEYKQKEKQKKAAQSKTQLKEIRLGATIGEHDLRFKVNHALKFLMDKNLVKFTILFKGRSIQHSRLGEQVFNKVLEMLKDVAVLEKPIKLEEKKLTMIVKPV